MSGVREDVGQAIETSNRFEEEANESEELARFTSIEDLIARTSIRRDELVTRAEIGALNAFGHERRSALWQIEQAVRPEGDLFKGRGSSKEKSGVGRSPLEPMTLTERVIADYAGRGLTLGPHPMALQRG